VCSFCTLSRKGVTKISIIEALRQAGLNRIAPRRLLSGTERKGFNLVKNCATECGWKFLPSIGRGKRAYFVKNGGTIDCPLRKFFNGVTECISRARFESVLKSTVNFDIKEIDSVKPDNAWV